MAALAAPMVEGIGFRTPNHDSAAIGKGGAVVASVDNPSAVYYNPAAITLLKGTQASGGVQFITLRNRYEDLDGRNWKNKDRIHAVPHLYSTYHPVGSPFAFGIGLVAPFGLSNEWPDDDDLPFRQTALEGSITYISAMPTVAYQINPQLSIGGGLTVNYGEAELIRGTTPGERAVFKGDDTSTGYHLGILWRPHTKHAFGANFRSHDKLALEGTSNTEPLAPGRENAKGNLAIPEFFVVGYSYSPTPAWNFEVNIDWTRWSRLKDLTLKTESGEQDIPFHWKSSFMYKFGATRYFSNGYRLSAGYIFSENSVPDENFTPLTADYDRHLASVGIGRKYDNLSWDIAIQYGYSPTRRVPDNPNRGPGEDPAGTYKTRTAAVSATIGYSF